MHVRQRRLEFRIGVDQVVDLAVIAALDEGAEPLRVRHRHVVLLLARGERGIEAGVIVRPRNEIDVELHLVARRRLVVLVEQILHDAGRRPVRHRHLQRHVLGRGGRAPRPPGERQSRTAVASPIDLHCHGHFRFPPIVNRYSFWLRTLRPSPDRSRHGRHESCRGRSPRMRDRRVSLIWRSASGSTMRSTSLPGRNRDDGDVAQGLEQMDFGCDRRLAFRCKPDVAGPDADQAASPGACAPPPLGRNHAPRGVSKEAASALTVALIMFMCGEPILPAT